LRVYCSDRFDSIAPKKIDRSAFSDVAMMRIYFCTSEKIHCQLTILYLHLDSAGTCYSLISTFFVCKMEKPTAAAAAAVAMTVQRREATSKKFLRRMDQNKSNFLSRLI
jgi:hypothetical protein